MEQYKSRKFIITLVGMIGAIALGYFSKIDANVAMVLGAGIASYNWANVKGDMK